MSAAISLPQTRRARKPSLTPMIDVVFLLLVFFMLVTRFGANETIALNVPGGGGTWSGPPRLLTVGAGVLRLNGVEIEAATVAENLRPLMPAADAPVLLRASDEATVQQLVEVIERLKAAGILSVVVVE